jgi:hypothetical protein
VESFLSVNQAAEKAGVAPGSVYRWLDNPDVPLTRHKTATGRVLIEERLPARLPHPAPSGR